MGLWGGQGSAREIGVGQGERRRSGGGLRVRPGVGLPWAQGRATGLSAGLKPQLVLVL